MPVGPPPGSGGGPGLRELDRFGAGDPEHLLVRGRCWDALQALELGGRVDVVLWDPPYADANHPTYRTRWDGWLSDLVWHAALIRDQPAPHGAAVVHISAAVSPVLQLVLDGVFGAANRIGELVWEDPSANRNTASYLQTIHEVVVVYARDLATYRRHVPRWREPKEGVEEVLEAARRAWSRSGGDPDRAGRLMAEWWSRQPSDRFSPKLRECRYFDTGGRAYYSVACTPNPRRDGPRYDVIHPTTGLPVKVPAGGWAYSRDTMDRLIAEGRIVFGPDHTTVPIRKIYLDETTTTVPRSVFRSPRSRGTLRLIRLLGRRMGYRFRFPKDPEVEARLIRLASGDRSDALVLDPMAGAGGTCDAVLQMNAADGGRRRVVAVTTNEPLKSPDGTRPGCFDGVLEPRVRALATGRRPDGSPWGDPLPGRWLILEACPGDPGAQGEQA